MIQLIVDKNQKLDFEVQIEGAKIEDVSATLKIKFNKLEIGFPAKVTSNSISISIPKLKNIIKSEFKKPIIADMELETIIDGCYKVPWKDKVQIGKDIHLEAKLNKPITSPNKKLPLIKQKFKQLNESYSKKSEVIPKTKSQVISRTKPKINTKNKIDIDSLLENLLD